MSIISCKNCKSEKNIKNGFVRGLQRYKCKECKSNFTNTPPRGKPQAMKSLAILLYTMCNASQVMIAKLLGVSHVSVYRWIKAEAESIKVPHKDVDSKYVMIDEMWHFVNGKKTKFGSGKPLIQYTGEILPGKLAHVLIER